ncbi:MAG TPA: BON domain-containing protein [Chloroflexota bacterium]|nr:BON domain-containing protein [Chloroflexota bacterium]
MSKGMWLLAAALGAAIVYFLDPNNGKSRRTTAMDRLGGMKGKAGDTASTMGQRAGDAVYGTVRETVTVAAHDNPNPDDRTLNDRVESEVFADPRVPKGRINTSVVAGVVTLRGQLDSQADIDYVIERVQAVRDVKGVQSYLHTPGTVAPNKEEAIEASDAVEETTA